LWPKESSHGDSTRRLLLRVRPNSSSSIISMPAREDGALPALPSPSTRHCPDQVHPPLGLLPESHGRHVRRLLPAVTMGAYQL
jgi:hypothetical protein